MLGGSSSSLGLASQVAPPRLPLNLPTRVFVPSDSGVADVYLTDLPRDLLASGGDLSGASGTIVHLHVFTIPSAGDTPIATTATSASARVLVLAKGQAGLYAGGGFFTTGDDESDVKGKASTFTGSVRGATLYLTHATPGFDDALGPSTLSGALDSSRNSETADAIARALTTVLEQVPRIE